MVLYRSQKVERVSIWEFKCPNCGKVFNNAFIFLLHKEKCFSLIWKKLEEEVV